MYSRDALCCWENIVLAVIFVVLQLTLGAYDCLASRVFDASHDGCLQAVGLGKVEGVHDSWVSEQVRGAKFGSWLVFCIASLEPEGEEISLTRCWLVLHDVGAGKIPCVK